MSDDPLEYLLGLYAQGQFLMAKGEADPRLMIIDPRERSVLPIKNLHVSRRLKRTVLKAEFEIKINTAFSKVIEACAAIRTPDRTDTWINPSIKLLFNAAHEQGHAHSVETWKGENLVGGLYGLQLGGAFFGESMFSTATDASKVALVHLCARLAKTGFTLLDAQFENKHLDQFGQTVIPKDEFLTRLREAMKFNPNFRGIDTNEIDLVRSYLNPSPK